MHLLRQLTIRARLTAMIATLLLLMAGITAGGTWGIASVHGIAHSALAEDVALATAAGDIRIQVLSARRFEKDSLITLADASQRERYVQRWQKTVDALAGTVERARTLPMPAEDAKRLHDMQAHLQTYRDGFGQVQQGIAAGRLTAAAQANDEMARYKTAIHALDSTSEQVAEHAGQRAAQVPQRVAEVRRSALATTWAMAALAIAFATVACWSLQRSITQPLARAVGVAESVAAGRVGDAPADSARDELAMLMNALHRMDGSLTQVVTRMRDASDSIATGSSQIAGGNADLSRRTEAQAASVQQTAASMDEFGSSVQSTADNARSATQMVLAAAQAAREGGAVVDEVVTQMADIADSARRMAEIVGVIDSIAFQTNILALNASVEAARAGDLGRGFAVVAGEVRTLAQRSAQAAREVKSLIVESGERVGAGSDKAQHAGRCMRDLVERVQQVSALVESIGAACREQSEGVGQVGQAITQIDQVTQQNAALVEESAAAAEGLRQQAQALAATVAHFQLASRVAG